MVGGLFVGRGGGRVICGMRWWVVIFYSGVDIF